MQHSATLSLACLAPGITRAILNMIKKYGGLFLMTDKKKSILYWCIISIFEVAEILLAVVCLIKYFWLENYLTALSLFSLGLWLVVGLLLIFHIEKAFD